VRRLFYVHEKDGGFWRKTVGVVDKGLAIDPAMRDFWGCEGREYNIGGVRVVCEESVDNNVISRRVYVDE